MNTLKKIAFEDILNSAEETERLKRKYLEERGWQHTSQTPLPCFWLWRKTIDGKEWSYTTEMALRVQTENESINCAF